MNQICRAFHQQLKCINDEHQMPIAHSVFKLSVHNITAHQLQQPTIEIYCKKNDTIASLINTCSKSFRMVEKTVIQLSMMLVSFGRCIL